MSPTTISLSPIARLFFSTIFSVVLAGTTSGVWAASFMGLGDLPGGNFQSSVEGISADGSIIAGMGTTASGTEAFRWTSDTGLVGLGTLPGGSFSSFPTGISADGSTIVAFNGVWTNPTGMVGLDDFFGEAVGGYAIDISADGSTIVGNGLEPYRWTSATGIVSLGDFPGGSLNRHVSAISADGSTIIGWWVFVGGNEAFRWTSDTGLVGLGDLPGGSLESPAEDVSGDGTIIVGGSDSDLGFEPFIWDESHGMRRLYDVLATDYGLGNALTGWDLGFYPSISDDGLTITGGGINPLGSKEAWVARLDAPHPVPEPGTLLLLGTGLAGIVAWRRKQSS